MASVPRPTRMSPPPSGARRTIATYASYQEAEQAVDLLSDERFPVNRVAIVGTGLRSVEQVVGRVTTGRAALTGAGQGALDRYGLQVDEEVADEARRLLDRTPAGDPDAA
jgi:hypothetical protein